MPWESPSRRLHLTDADRLTAGPQQQVDDPQPVPVGKRLETALQLDCRALAGQRGARQGGAALDTGRSVMARSFRSAVLVPLTVPTNVHRR